MFLWNTQVAVNSDTLTPKFDGKVSEFTSWLKCIKIQHLLIQIQPDQQNMGLGGGVGGCRVHQPDGSNLWVKLILLEAF